MAHANTFSKTNLAIGAVIGFTIAAWSIYKLNWHNGLFSTSFLPHQFCYLQQPGLIWTNAVSDGLIWLAYAGISIALSILLWRTKGLLPFRWVFVAFGLFILACGFTHFMEVVTVWYPLYWLSAFIKVLTAIASIATLIALIPLIPTAVSAIRLYREAYEQSTIEREEALSQLLQVETRRVAERDASLRALQQAESKYRQIFESAPVGIYQSAIGGEFISANPELARIWGYKSPLEMISESGNVALRLFADPAKRNEFLRIVGEQGEIRGFEYEGVRKDGSRIWVSEDSRYIRDERGNPATLEGMVTDITARVRNEQELRASEEKYRLLFIANPQPMWVYEVESLKFLDVNGAAIRTYGYGKADFLSMTLRDIRPQEDIPTLMEAAADRSLNTRGDIFRHRKKDGTGFHVEISEDSIEYQGRSGKLVVAVDVSERLKLEEQLRQLSKMEAVGQLAGGVAHDFNNLVMVMQNYCELLGEHVSEERPRKYLGEIKTASQRAAAITQQLLAFSRKQVLQPKSVNLNEVLAGSLSMLKPLIGEHIQFVVHSDENLWNINADPVQIEQVLMNLAVNARDAMPTGGAITIQTENVSLDEQYSSIHYPVKPGRFAMLSISDTGIGMSSEIQKKIFEPFFTTKEPGSGTGLGLSTVYGIVKQSGGFIWVYSELDQGTVFKLYFPAVGAKIEEFTGSTRGEPKMMKGTGTILLVEDEKSLAEVESEFLRAAGFKVLVASDSAEAMRTSSEHAETIDLLVTDVVLPGISGLELANQLRSDRVGLRVIFMSGYASGNLRSKVPAGENLLQKPFTLSTLGRTVQEALDL
jgi:two-component system, cell cycle sensor histidine kinase and response regulator CckA